MDDSNSLAESVKIPETPAAPDTAAETLFTDTRDGNAYRTVNIGDQVWMAENLRYSIESSWCYDNDEANCERYGRLYTWEAAKKACPAGWHLPSYGEWCELTMTAGNYRWAGKELKSKSGWVVDGPHNRRTCFIRRVLKFKRDWALNGTDAYGFSALPGGIRYDNGRFYDAGRNGFWWTATDNIYLGGNIPYIQSMSYHYDSVNEGICKADFGLSVRCLADCNE